MDNFFNFYIYIIGVFCDLYIETFLSDRFDGIISTMLYHIRYPCNQLIHGWFAVKLLLQNAKIGVWVAHQTKVRNSLTNIQQVKTLKSSWRESYNTFSSLNVVGANPM